MSELPRTDDLPRTEEGYDPLRVEEAFTSFAERVHELEEVAAELRAELRSLRHERSVALAPPEDDPDWPAEHGVGDGRLAASPDWVAVAVPPPLQRPIGVPRLALEAVFLLLVALFAGLADLAPEWIVAPDGRRLGRRRARRVDGRGEACTLAPGRDPAAARGGADTGVTGRWSNPVVEATAFAPPDVSESRTVVTKLPVDPEVAKAQVSIRRTRQRRRSPSRRQGRSRSPRGAASSAAAAVRRQPPPPIPGRPSPTVTGQPRP